MTQNEFAPQEVLMCSPTSFDVRYVINPWMEQHVDTLDKTMAEGQWNNLYQHLQGYHNVHVIPATEGLFDMVFVANAALAIGNKAVVSNFKFTQRQGESSIWKSWFISHGYETLQLNDDLHFEGEGDALYDPVRTCIWAGYGQRSDRNSYAQIGDFLSRDIVYLELVNPYYYHLDTCFSVLPDEYLLYLPDAFSSESLGTIYELVQKEKRIEINREEAKDFSCNMVSMGRKLVCNKLSSRIEFELRERGFEVIQCTLSEFIKSGGAAKCLVLTLYKE